MRALLLSVLATAALSACGGPSRVGDARAQALLAMPVPQYYAELAVARELLNACQAYVLDTKLAEDMNELRNSQGRGSVAAARQTGAIGLETQVKKRSIAARNGGSFETLDPCTTLDQENVDQTPMSVFILSKR